MDGAHRTSPPVSWPAFPSVVVRGILGEDVDDARGDRGRRLCPRAPSRPYGMPTRLSHGGAFAMGEPNLKGRT